MGGGCLAPPGAVTSRRPPVAETSVLTFCVVASVQVVLQIGSPVHQCWNPILSSYTAPTPITLDPHAGVPIPSIPAFPVDDTTTTPASTAAFAAARRPRDVRRVTVGSKGPRSQTEVDHIRRANPEALGMSSVVWPRLRQKNSLSRPHQAPSPQ